MTDIIRTDPPEGSLAGFFVVLGLVVLIGLFSLLTIFGFFLDFDQIILSVWMAVIFLLLAVLIDVYRRVYMPDELIHKKRRPKVVFRRAIR